MNHINAASTNLIEDFDTEPVRSRGKYNYFSDSDEYELTDNSKRSKKKRDRRESFSDWN